MRNSGSNLSAPQRRRHRVTTRRRHPIHHSGFETLEARYLLATVTVNAGATIRAVDTKWLGINTSPWDSQLSSAQTSTMTTALGTTTVRIGGGSYVDANWHFSSLTNGNQSIGQQAAFIAAHGNIGYVTVNYGTASPQEAAAELAYLNGSTSDNTVIGVGEQWNTTTSTWVDVDWGKVSDWANLRASPQLKNDDGRNYLRLGGSVPGQSGVINLVTHPAPFGFHYWGIGNEIYGATWETDEHGTASDHLPMPAGTTRAAHDPTTIVSFAKQFQTLANEIDPTISVGIDSQATDGQFNNWIANVLKQANSTHQNLNLGFVSDHLYDQQPYNNGQNPPGESDATLLAAPSTVISPTPANPLDWVQRAAKYRSLINTNYGTTAGAGVELLATEFNSVSSNPGKQITSLVNGVFVADSIGSIMQTEYNGAYIWQLHNNWISNANNSSSLYGWRAGGDYGVMGIGDITSKPSVGSNIPYPNYFAEQLASKIIQSGGTVVSTGSNDSTLDVYSVLQANGHLDLLVVNKSKLGLNNDTTGTPSINNVTFNISGFTLGGSAQMWQYGSAEDNAQKNSTTGLSSLTTSNPTLTLNGSSFTLGFPSLSMSVIDLSPPPPKVIAMAFPYNTAPNQVQFTFDQDMLSTSITAGDLMLTNTDGGSVPPVLSVQWDSPSKTATFLLSPSQIPNANFTAALSVGSVSSKAGIATNAAYSFSFFSLPGDANHDRTVNLLDLNVLATNFGNSAATFSQGDFDYNTTVGMSDFNVLAANFGNAVASPQSAPVPTAAPLAASQSLFGAAPIASNPLLAEDLLDSPLSDASPFFAL
ncbi:MAG TPA: hypothetical protein VHS31_03565 [Tepidisphaeraceae bacterium]|jgi:hypothetical protein|nr:hypothetical protein [Tepidisphaeraceae bacterium]